MEKLVRHAEGRGIKALFITVDAPQLGRREKDMRMDFDDEGAKVQNEDQNIDRSQGAAKAITVSAVFFLMRVLNPASYLVVY